MSSLPMHALLPTEVLEEIFGYLDASSLGNCSRVCRRWRAIVNRMTYPNIGYLPNVSENELLCNIYSAIMYILINLFKLQIMGKIFSHLDFPSILSARQVCSFWREGVDTLTRNDHLMIDGESLVSYERANQLRRWKILEERDDNLKKDSNNGATSNWNPFPARVIKVILSPDNIHSKIKTVSIIRALSIFGKEVHFLNIKIQNKPLYEIQPMELGKTLRMRTVALVVRQILSHMENLRGLSIHFPLSFEFDLTAELLGRKSNRMISSPSVPLQVPEFCKTTLFSPLPFRNLKTFRIISWDFKSEEMESLYLAILRDSPNLEYFDPDFHMGYHKLQGMYMESPSKLERTFEQLTCLKLAVPVKVLPQFYRVLRHLKAVHFLILDIFDENRMNEQGCKGVLQELISSTKKRLTTLSLSFYSNSRFVPPIYETKLKQQPNCNTNYVNRILIQSKKICNHPRLQSIGMGGLLGENQVKNLRLRGVTGQLNFLKKFKHLERLILLDYNRWEQAVFIKEKDFFRNLPSLKVVYTPYFGNAAQSSLLKTTAVENRVLKNVFPLCF